MITKQFEANQKDLSLSDAKINWCGSYVRLYLADKPGNDLAVITTDARTVAKIQAWCVKNHYRCSQIRNGIIYL